MFSFSGIIVHMTWPLDHLTTTPVDSHTLIPGLFSFDVVYSQHANWCYYCMMRCSQYSLLYGSIHWCTYNSRMVCYDIVCFNLCGVWQWVLHSCSSCHVTGSYSVSYLSTYYVVEYYSDRYNCGFLGWARCYRSQNRLACICICKLGSVMWCLHGWPGHLSPALYIKEWREILLGCMWSYKEQVWITL